MKTVFLAACLCGASPLMAAPPVLLAQLRMPRKPFGPFTPARMPPSPGRMSRDVLFGCAPDYREVHTEPKVRGMSFTVAQLRPMIHSMLFFAKTASRKTVIQEIAFTSGGTTVTVKQHMVLWMPVPKQQTNTAR